MKSIFFSFTIGAIFFALLFLTSASNPVFPSGDDWLKQMKQVEASTVVLNNKSGIIPVQNIVNNRIASVNIGSAYANEFDSLLNKYTAVASMKAPDFGDAPSLDRLNSDLKLYNTIIVQVTDATVNDHRTQDFIRDLDKSENRQLLLVLFGNVSSLKHLDGIRSPVVWTSINSPVSAVFTAQVLFGGVSATARLATSVSPRYTTGSGFTTAANRLKYTLPEEVGINGRVLETSVDKIMAEAITGKATPGAAVMVVKDGKVIFNKGYGHHTYNKAVATKADDIFDLASVTKISATTIAAMKLYEEQKLKLDTNLGAYLPLARSTTKNSLSIRQLMLHEGGLTPFIPFYQSLKPADFRRDSSELYSVKVADSYYLKRNYYEEVMLPRMLNTKLQPAGKYVYSDLSMYFLKEAIERQAVERLDQYVLNYFYRPLGMQTAGFNPRNRFDKARIVPTENDLVFRKTLLEGYVHDQGAAMAGGVAGHAGLFASANDLAILYQMLLNGGTYGGEKYFSPQTIQLFTSRQSLTSHRGLGFDRWNPESGNYPSNLASSETYGHTGYTGTCVWVDPKHQLIYIFLSNRVHPSVTNKLSSMRIRPRIQDAIYEAIQAGGKKL
ncbi:serine hydrolase [Pedobacter sp. SYSU D00535]|uniref:serine hydrolase domain-containing protein n=1 Tax=Pedobacter sp. SYSU D00535 TaxID=2810308 RepID=UPI001A97A249|nr:serine hydrolase [Pedobacter sp. SYSU D00535]